MGGLNDWLFGSKDKLKKIPTKNPGQNVLHNSILQQLQQMLGQGGGYNNAQNYYNDILGGPDAFQNFSEPYLQQFQEQTAPRIAEQYAGQGALSSSGFGQALGGAGAGLQSQLAQLFSQLQQNAAGAQSNQFNQLGQFGLGYEPFAYKNKQGSSGMIGPLLGGIGMGIGGPLGGALGGGIASLFQRN